MDNIIIDSNIYTGRPADCGKRLKKEIACYDFLDALGIHYTRVDHMAADTITACEQVEEILNVKICKNLFLCNRQSTDFYLLLMDGEKPFKTKDLSKQIGTSRLSFASAEAMNEYLNITPGSVSVLGLLFDVEKKVKLLIDRSVLDKSRFACHPCINTSSIAFKTSDLLEKVLPEMERTAEIVDLPCYDAPTNVNA